MKNNILTPISHAVRRLRSHRSFAAFGVSSLALAVGALTVGFAGIDLSANLAGTQNVLAVSIDTGRGDHVLDPMATYAIAKQAKSFSAVATESWVNSSLVFSGTSQRSIPAVITVGAYFDVLGVRPVRGRFFANDPSDEGTAVIGYDLWRTQFSSRRDFGGFRITVGGQSFAVVGVAPRLGGSLTPPSIWLHQTEAQGAKASESTRVLARLRSSVSNVGAQIELGVLARRRFRLPRPSPHVSSPPVDAMKPLPIATAVFALAVVLMVAACVNVAGLFLVQGIRESDDTSVRAVLGASPGLLIAQVVCESLAVALIGICLGFAVSFVGMRFVDRLIPAELSRLVALPQVNTPTFALMSGILAAATLTAAVAPAVRSMRLDLGAFLKAGGYASTSSFRPLLPVIAAQSALALALLAVALGLGVSVYHVHTNDEPVDLRNALAARLNIRTLMPISAATRDTAAERKTYEQEGEANLAILAAVRDLAEVKTASTMFWAQVGRHQVIVDNGTFLSQDAVVVVSADFVSTLGLQLVDGRGLDQLDDENGPTVLVDDIFARRAWHALHVVGRYIEFHDGRDIPSRRRVVGVVKHFDLTPAQTRTQHEIADQGSIFERDRSAPVGSTLLIAVHTPSARTVESIAATIHRAAPLATFSAPQSADRERSIIAAQQSFVFGLGLFLCGAALLLLGIGVFGVAQLSASARRREIAVRVALGANRRDMLRALFAPVVGVAVAASIGGIILTLWFEKALGANVMGLEQFSPSTIPVAELILCAITVIATTIPARDVLRSDPVEALRSQ